MPKEKMIREVLSIAETPDGVFLMFIDYPEDDIARGTGHVWSIGKDTRIEGKVPDNYLATNVELRTMWASPEGSLWVASADGTVGTTAPVGWAKPTSGIDYLTFGNKKWFYADLPRLKNKLPPNVYCLGGTSDSDVYAGIYNGHIYHYDGKVWSQIYEAEEDGPSIHAIGGTKDNIFAVGDDLTMLHYDGKQWKKLEAAGKPMYSETLTGIINCKDQDVMICTSSSDGGRILKGNASGFKELVRSEIQFLGIAEMQGRIFIAGDNGVAELIENEVKYIRQTFKPGFIRTGIDRVFFLGSIAEVGFIDYDPRLSNDKQWWGLQF